MKAKSFLLIALSCLLVVGCKKSEEKTEPTPPEPSFTKITEDQLKSYFPYIVGDEFIFRCDVIVEDRILRVDNYSFTNKAGKMIVDVNFIGRERYAHIDGSNPEYFHIDLKAEVTNNKILKMDSEYEYIIYMPYDTKVPGTYTYDASQNDSLPERISLSDVATIKKDIGLTYYVDDDGYEFYFLKRK